MNRSADLLIGSTSLLTRNEPSGCSALRLQFRRATREGRSGLLPCGQPFH